MDGFNESGRIERRTKTVCIYICGFGLMKQSLATPSSCSIAFQLLRRQSNYCFSALLYFRTFDQNQSAEHILLSALRGWLNCAAKREQICKETVKETLLRRLNFSCAWSRLKELDPQHMFLDTIINTCFNLCAPFPRFILTSTKCLWRHE